MDKHEIQKLRDLPIEGVAERLGLQVSRHKCLCPFHDDSHPSLSRAQHRRAFCHPADPSKRAVCAVHPARLQAAKIIMAESFALSENFINFAIKDGEITPSRQKKKNQFFCFALDFS